MTSHTINFNENWSNNDATAELQNQSGDDAIAVCITDLDTRFMQDGQPFYVHQNLNLDVKRGEILTIVGGSGTGKTVLLRHILGLTKPSRGSVKINGVEAVDIPRNQASTQLGMLFQHGALFSAFNVLDNIAFPLREKAILPDAVVRDAAMVKLQMVGLKPEHALRMPAELSGGMIKRVALARALCMEPPLLLLDEPTAGLDPHGSDEFCNLLLRLHQQIGFTVIMVTHDLDSLYALSSRVAVLAEKRVLVVDTVKKVMQVNHPFIETFFLGERGRRSLAPLIPESSPAQKSSIEMQVSPIEES